MAEPATVCVCLEIYQPMLQAQLLGSYRFSQHFVHEHRMVDGEETNGYGSVVSPE